MFTANTFILTTQGFQPIAADLSHLVANFDPNTAQLIGYTPAAITEYTYTGNILSFTGLVDLQLTADSLLYASASNTLHRRIHPCYQFYNLKQAFAPMRLRRGGSGTLLDGIGLIFADGDPLDWALLIGFAIGDGYAKSGNIVTFHLKRQRKIDFLHQLCARLPVCLVAGSDNHYRVSYPNLGNRFREALYAADGQKQIPVAFLQAGQGIIQSLLRGLLQADGYQGTMLTTTSWRVADAVLALGAISGNLFSLREDKDCYRLQRIQRLTQPHLNDSRGSQTQLSRESYSGSVFEVKTDTGLVLLRRGRRTVLMGSSLAMARR